MMCSRQSVTLGSMRSLQSATFDSKVNDWRERLIENQKNYIYISNTIQSFTSTKAAAVLADSKKAHQR